MEEMILNLIMNGLFPIAACVSLGYFCVKTIDNYRNDIKEISATHKAELDAMTEAIQNNTLIIQRLVDKLDKDDNKEE